MKLVASAMAFAACVEGLRGSSSGAAVLRHSASADIEMRLPTSLIFSERGSPWLDVQIDSRVQKPETAADSSVALSVDSQQGLHLHPKSGSADSTWVPLAWADYKNTVTKNGWGYLSVRATDNPKVSDDLKMYAAGFLEGFVSGHQIKEFQHNADALIKKDEANHQAMGNIRSLFEKQANTICQQSGLIANATVSSANLPKDLWWRHARFMLVQAWGLLDSYNQHADNMKGVPMSLVDLLILNSDGETPELEMAYDFQEVALRQATKECGNCDDDDNATGTVFLQKRSGTRTKHGAALQPELGTAREQVHRARARRTEAMRKLDDAAWRKIKQSTGRCSALVRLATNNSDIFVGHTTFSDYSEMNRIWKFYDFPLAGGASKRMGFSSYPGVTGSTDDYYLMDTGLMVTETTVSMLSDEAFDNLNDTAVSIPDYMRIMLSNRLAKTGAEWVDYMKKSATGTYNSQWMVVDYNRFEPGKKLKNGTLWVLEQAPGVSAAEDASAWLQANGFWASENRAAFTAVRNVSGELEAEDEHGALFSAQHNPRANIFAKTAPEVNLLSDMRAEMQRNKWPHDVDGGPGNTPDHAIAARGDLASGESASPNGGVDSKVTSACLVRKLSADAIAGPTHDGQKAFKWTDDKGRALYPDYPRDGLPNLWNFDWVRMTPDGEESIGSECVHPQ